MARTPRIELPEVPLHIIQRGNNRLPCFFGDVDRRFYLKCLAEAAGRRGCAVHAYVLMSNHVHLLVTPKEQGAASAMMQDIGRRYVRVINTLYGRSGTLWEGRYKSSLIDSDNYLLTCHRYIELNPVRAGITDKPDDYAWSSHRHYANAIADPAITEHEVFAALGASATDRQEAFRSLFHLPMDQQTLKQIRDAANSGSALGSEDFLRRTENLLGRTVRTPAKGRPVKIAAPETASLQSEKLF